jgi:hypothetical protein
VNQNLILHDKELINSVIVDSKIISGIKIHSAPSNYRERAVSMVQAGMTHQAVANHFYVSKITIPRLMIRLRQRGRTDDRPRNDRPRVTSQRQGSPGKSRGPMALFKDWSYHRTPSSESRFT